MSLSFRGADKEIVIFKGGNTYDKFNFPQLMQSISSVKIKIEQNRSALFEINVNPSREDGIKILQTGALTMMTDYATKLETASFFKQEQNVSPSLSELEATITQAANILDTQGKSLPVVAIKLKWPGETLPNGNEAETPWFVGAATNPDVSFDLKAFSFTIKGTAVADRVAGVYGSKVFKNTTIIDILKKIDSSLKFKSLDDETTARVNNTKLSFAYNDSSKAAMERLLYETNITYFTQDDTVYLKNRDAIYRSRPLYQFVAFRQINPAKNIYPIIEYSSDSLGRLLTGGLALGTLAKSYDMQKKEVVSEGISQSLNSEIKDAVKKQESSTDNGAPTISHPYRKELNTISSIENQIEPKSSAANRIEFSHKRSMDSYLEVNLTTMGIPNILPGTMVDVRIGDDSNGDGLPGVSGKGVVQVVEHLWDSSGWRSQLFVRIGASIGSVEYKDIPEFDPDSISETDILSKEVQEL